MKTLISNILHSFMYLMSSNTSHIKLYIFIVCFKYITIFYCIFFRFCNNCAIDICIFLKVIVFLFICLFKTVKKMLESLEKLIVVKIHFSSTSHTKERKDQYNDHLTEKSSTFINSPEMFT